MEREETRAERLPPCGIKIQTGLGQVERGETVSMDEVFAGADKMIARARGGKA